MEDWYSAQISGDNAGSNPFANPALRLTPNTGLEAFLAVPGNTLLMWLKVKEALNAQ